MKVLIADKFDESGRAQLAALASELEADASLKADTLVAKVQQFDPTILIVRSTKVPAEVLKAGEALKLVIRAGAGVDNIDLPAASSLGIDVANCPGKNAAAVAELTIGLIIALDRKIPDNVADLRAGRWNKKGYSKGLGLKGKTIGVVGAGGIGTEVVRRAIPFGMNVLFTNLGRNRRLVDFPNVERTELEELVQRSDIITVHIPGSPETKSLIGADLIAKMKPSALVLNTSRAGIIDEAALIAALKEGRIRGAAVDVYDGEPPADATEITTPLADAPNFYGTHHIGASTEEAQAAVADEVVNIVSTYRQSGKVLNCVNTTQSHAASLLTVRLVNKPGSLAAVFQHLAAAKINVEEMDHIIYAGGKAASAHIRLDRVPNDDELAAIRADKAHVIGAQAIPVD